MIYSARRIVYVRKYELTMCLWTGRDSAINDFPASSWRDRLESRQCSARDASEWVSETGNESCCGKSQHSVCCVQPCDDVIKS